MSNLAALVIVASGIIGQAEDGAPNCEHLDGFKEFIGDWEASYIVPAGIPEIGNEGDKVDLQCTYRWMLKKNFLAFSETQKANGVVKGIAREITYWDANAESLKMDMFYSTGFHGRGCWQRRGDSWQLEWCVVGPDKTEYKGTSTLKKLGKDAYSWQMTGLTADGKKLPDWPLVEYNRVKAER